MDFDSIIPFLFLLAFFILPNILKWVKTKNAKSVKPNKKPSIFDRVSERIQQFVQELEQKARQPEQAGTNQESAWDRLADDQTSSQDFEISDQKDDYFRESEIPAYHDEMEEPEKKITKQNIKVPVIEKKHCIQSSGSTNLIFRSTPLQNAIIWSEVLGKPVGLRE